MLFRVRCGQLFGTRGRAKFSTKGSTKGNVIVWSQMPKFFHTHHLTDKLTYRYRNWQDIHMIVL